MILGRVTGTVHATAKNARLLEHRILVVRSLDANQRAVGRPILCLDRVDAGVGDLVLVNREGSGARQLLGDDLIPVQALVIAVVDGLEFESA